MRASGPSSAGGLSAYVARSALCMRLLVARPASAATAGAAGDPNGQAGQVSPGPMQLAGGQPAAALPGSRPAREW
eukprot:7374547-Lingulodinium_polyedra.AAC.1